MKGARKNHECAVMRENGKKLFSRGMHIFLLSGVLFLCCAPVPTLVLEERRREERPLFTTLLVLSEPVITRYIHSVERTPVEDEYYPSHGTLWQWEERVRSHNAGLPFSKRPGGTFFQDSSWMYFRGGGAWFSSISLRVGTEEFGRNQLELPGSGPWNLFRIFPEKSLTLRIEETPLLKAVFGSSVSALIEE